MLNFNYTNASERHRLSSKKKGLENNARVESVSYSESVLAEGANGWACSVCLIQCADTNEAGEENACSTFLTLL